MRRIRLWQKLERPSRTGFNSVFVEKNIMVFKVFTQDEVLCSALASRPLSLQFQVVVFLRVFKVYTQDKARCSVLWSRTLTFQFLVVVAKIFSQFLVQAFSRNLWRSSLRVFFVRFTACKKVHLSRRVRVRGCTGTRAHAS